MTKNKVNPFGWNGGLFFPVFFFLIYDNYLSPPGVRFFDVCGVIYLAALLCTGRLQTNFLVLDKVKLSFLSLLLGMELIISGFQGVLFQESLAIVPFVGGIIIYQILIHSKLFIREAEDLLINLIRIASLVIIFQYFIYLLIGEMPSLIIFDDGSTGLRSAFGIAQRGTGLYIEPGSHAASIIYLLYGYLLFKNKFSWDVWLASFGIILSQSLFGIFGLLLLLLTFYLFGNGKYSTLLVQKYRIYILNKMAIIILISFIFFLSGLIFRTSLFEDTPFQTTFIERIEVIENAAYGIGEEGSFGDRLGGIADGSFFEITLNKPLLNQLFGDGLSSGKHQELGGTNTFAWLITSFGYIGSLILISSLFSILGFSVLSAVFIGMMLIPYPLTSYAFFWMALAFFNVALRNGQKN